MKKLMLVLLFMGFITVLKSQDTIITIKNDTIFCKINKITRGEISYTKILSAKEIADENVDRNFIGLPEIQYTGNEVVTNDFTISLKHIKKYTGCADFVYSGEASSDYFKKASTNLVVGVSCTFILSPLIIYGASGDLNKQQRNNLYALGSIVGVIGVIELIVGAAQIGKAGVCLDKERKIYMQTSQTGVGVNIKF